MVEDEIEEINKRLEEIEKAIGELRTGRELAIMKAIASELCTIHCNIFVISQKGVDTGLWGRKLAEAKQAIRNSETIEDAVKTRDNFVREILNCTKMEPAKGEPAEETAEPARAEEVGNADRAMEIAYAFMKKDNSVALPMKAVQRSDYWLVDVDVGVVRMEIVRVKVDSKTGEILGHETVEKK
jgi:GTP-sensing pleiotropic transcriptional regulator CodY